MKTKAHTMFGPLAVLLVAFWPATSAAQLTHLQSNCPNNSCTMYLGVQVPSLMQVPKPGPATGATDFHDLGYPWTFSFQTANPLSWTFSDQGYWYTADFGEGGHIDATGPDGTFSGVITSGHAEGGEMPFAMFSLQVSFRGQWSNGKRAIGSVDLEYINDIGEQFYSTFNMIQISAGHSKTQGE